MIFAQPLGTQHASKIHISSTLQWLYCLFKTHYNQQGGISMITILLVRHGQASFGEDNYDKLSNLGVEQAQMLGQHYSFSQRRIDAIFSGSLIRQQDSARHFLRHYQSSLTTDDTAVIINADSLSFDDSESNDSNIQSQVSSDKKSQNHIITAFNEFNHHNVFKKSNPVFASQGAISAQIAQFDNPQARLAELFDQAMQRWHGGEHDEDYQESWPQFNSRVQQALTQLITQITKDSRLDKDSTIMVFTSGGVIAAITAHLLQQGSMSAYQFNKNMINSGVTTVTLHKKGPRLLSLNEYSHLFAKGESFLTWR